MDLVYSRRRIVEQTRDCGLTVTSACGPCGNRSHGPESHVTGKASGALHIAFLMVIGLLSCSCIDSSRTVSGRDLLITGKAIRSTTQQSQELGNLPVNLALSPDARYVITTDVGYYESLWSIRTSDGKGVSHIDYSNRPSRIGGEVNVGPATRRADESNGLYYGLAIAPDNTIYAAQGAHDTIAVVSLDANGNLQQRDTIRTRKHDFPAGLALDASGLLYVANNASGEQNPYKMTGSVAIYDPATRSELGRYTFSDSHYGTSNFPLGIAALEDGTEAYVAAERDDAVYVLDTHDPRHPSLKTRLETGAHPVAVLLSHDQKTLFVANSLSDTISVIDTKQDRIIATVLLRPRMARDLPGVSPVGLALSPDQKTLYAALGDMNAVAVIDVADADDAQLRGYIPTGWYPTGLAVTADGKRLLVCNAKGTSVRNPNNVTDARDPRRHHSSLTVLEGNLISVDIPRDKELDESTRQVLQNNRLDLLEKPQTNPLAGIGLAAGKITHVLYVIKENRTYDQILGDMPQGNGDKSLVLFGQNITRNQHALAERFVLLDNLYACGEVSGDGWDWSTQGMADAYVIRNIPYHYSHRGRRFDSEGQNNGYPVGGAPAHDENGKPLWRDQAFQVDAKPIPDVASTNRNLWDAAKDAGISLRNYGFFVASTATDTGLPKGPDNIPAAPGLQPGGHDLEGVTDVDFRRFDMNYPDSEAPSFYFNQTGDKHCLFPMTGYGKYKMPSRFSEWNREFQMMLAKDPTGAAVPNLMLIRMPTDHSVGGRSASHSPDSYTADNDYGLAQIVETVSRSAIWPHTAIFVIEDDAQSGIDHVDAHRTTAYIISPWIKRGSIDHHFHNTDSVLKTMELLLGLKPLSQYDAVADPILDWDDAPRNSEPFIAKMPPKELVAKLNPSAAALAPTDPRRKLAEESDAMDFDHADAAPARELDEITWKIVRGTDLPMPKLRGVTDADVDDD